MKNVFGPQVPGGRYFNGYYKEEYTVLALVHHMDWRGDSIRVRWVDGSETEHSTAWNPTSDKILSS